ncbi:aminopeptidase N-like [Alosa pseudoharengus]|uniref:aminopeptidase N-like n=1 Tax=Alosa pseudoharengus TaxID=34774 RepID=UPI003F88626A
MAKGCFVPMGLAVALGIITLSAVVGIITMGIIFHMQFGNSPLTAQAPTTTTPMIPAGPPPNLRLPRDVVPQSYSIFLRPHFYPTVTKETNQTFTFTGNSSVTFVCFNKTSSIFLHSKDLNIRNLELRRLDNSEILAVGLHDSQSTVSETDVLEVRLQDDAVLEPNRSYSLIAEFEGQLANDLTGFYTSTYEVEKNNDTRYIGATQMEATEARRVFPCFDEPDLKAEFRLTLIHRQGTSALGNWPKQATSGFEIEIDGEKWTVTEFRSTRKMSTYLVAFVVFDFDYTGGKDLKVNVLFLSLLIKVWARPEAIAAGHAKYAETVTPKILNFYEMEFGINYPVGKLDQIALPDLAPVGMENWGLITYRESALLFVEGVSTTFNKEYTAMLIAHELAHQWFGNLVTMEWWNDLWLNEGFATFMSYQGLNHLEPTWNAEALFLVDEVQIAFQVDALATAHPLRPTEEEIQTPGEISGLFDTITYSKGAAVLRMLSHYMGQSEFKQGIREYLKDLQYRSADQNDLWTNLQKAVHHDSRRIKEFMSAWTTQAGYPVLSVNTNNGGISQERFLLNGTGNNHVVWHVPVKALKSDGSLAHHILLDRAGPVAIPELKSDKWILVNMNCTGYYRVNYNLENWQRLMDQLKAGHHAIPMISRAQLIDDAFNLARAKYVDVTLALSTTKYLKNETEYIPWYTALRHLDYFILMFDRSEVYGPMQSYVKDQITNLYRHFENDTMNNTVPKNHLDQYAQLEAVTMACKVGLKECIDTATKMFNRWKENPYNMIHPNLRSSVYCYAIANGGEAEWEFAWEMYLNSTNAAEKDTLRYGLSCTRHIWLLNRYLQYTLDPTKIRKMDTVPTINYIASNVAGQGLAWDWLRAHWKYFSQEHGGERVSFGNLIDGVTERFSTEYELQQLKQFQRDLTEDSLGSAYGALEQAIERTQANIKWVEEHKDTVLHWFRSETKSSA